MNYRILDESLNFLNRKRYNLRNKGIYHISLSPKLKHMNPQIPDNYMTKNGYEDGKLLEYVLLLL